MTFDEASTNLAKMVFTTSDSGSYKIHHYSNGSVYEKLLLREFIYAKAYMAFYICCEVSNSNNKQEAFMIKDLMFQKLKRMFEIDKYGYGNNYSDLVARFEYYLNNVEIFNNITREYISCVNIGLAELMSLGLDPVVILKIMTETHDWMISKMDEKQNGGCYVATCVYGSYDCPEVWMMRRFRDNVLNEVFLGKIFIRVYYSISPILVKYFGGKTWFKDSCKYFLDKFVNILRNKGFSDLPYCDKNGD